jgi:hypothetical protein
MSFVKWVGNHVTVFLPDHSPCSTAPPILNSPCKRLQADNPLPWNHPKAIAENYARFGYTGFVQSKKCIGVRRFLFEMNRSDRWNRQKSPLTTFRMTILRVTYLFTGFCSDTPPASATTYLAHQIFTVWTQGTLLLQARRGFPNFPRQPL